MGTILAYQQSYFKYFFDIIPTMVQEMFMIAQQKEINMREAARLSARVRDIPYALGTGGNVDRLLENKAADCADKHLFLRKKLQELGYKVELGMAQFDWRNLPIPEDILSLLKQPVQHHLFLYTGFEKAENILDVTFDQGMKHLGFSIFDWDGSSPTDLTVKAIKISKIKPIVLDTRSFISSKIKQLKHLNNEPTPFNDAFNAWLGEKRRQTTF